MKERQPSSREAPVPTMTSENNASADFWTLVDQLRADLDLADKFYVAGLRKEDDRGRKGTLLLLRRLSILLKDLGLAPPISLTRLTIALDNVARGHHQTFLDA